jgi:hypothetical protein
MATMMTKPSMLISTLICSHCKSWPYNDGASGGVDGLDAVMKLNTGLGSLGNGFVAAICQK